MEHGTRDFLPLDFAATLDLLATWEGRDVIVIAHSQVPGEHMSHTQVALQGTLGPVQMVDNTIDTNADSVAAYPVGSQTNVAFYISSGDFVHAQPLPGGSHINIKFAHDFHIEVQAP